MDLFDQIVGFHQPADDGADCLVGCVIKPVIGVATKTACKSRCARLMSSSDLAGRECIPPAAAQMRAIVLSGRWSEAILDKGVSWTSTGARSPARLAMIRSSARIGNLEG